MSWPPYPEDVTPGVDQSLRYGLIAWLYIQVYIEGRSRESVADELTQTYLSLPWPNEVAAVLVLALFTLWLLGARILR